VELHELWVLLDDTGPAASLTRLEDILITQGARPLPKIDVRMVMPDGSLIGTTPYLNALGTVGLRLLCTEDEQSSSEILCRKIER
jgi:hypothetical protein